MPDFGSAQAAIEGSGPSVASTMAARFRDRVTDTPLDQMTKRGAILALWRLRTAARSASLPGTASLRHVLLPGSRIKAVIKASERQLGVHEGRTAMTRA